MDPRFKISDFKHKFDYRVRSHECDRQFVVHNARYLEILEIARIEYCRDALGFPIDAGTFATHHKFVFVRNAIDYFSPTQFDDLLEIYTRVSRLGRTSVSLEQLVDCKGRRVLEAEAVMVSIDEVTNRPKELDQELRERAKAWESR